MPRRLIGVSVASRVSISFAALLVNVTATIDSGLAWPVASSHAMRVVSTRVLPLPAPARISAEACGSVTAASCSGLRLASSGEVMSGGAGTAQDERRGHAGSARPELYAAHTKAIIAPLMNRDSKPARRPDGTPPANSATMRAFVHWIRAAAPYVHAFRGQTFVIAFGGEVV